MAKNLFPPPTPAQDYYYPSFLRTQIKVCSFSKLIRISCVILSAATPTHQFLGTTLHKSPTLLPHEGIILIKKSAFSNHSPTHTTLSLTIRPLKVMRCTQITIPTTPNCVKSHSTTRFSQCSLLISQNRGGIPLICATHLTLLTHGLCFVYSISLSVKRINPSGKANIDMIFALIASY